MQLEVLQKMKTARFSEVVKKCGQPEVYLAFMAPDRDTTLQSAIRHHHVMTVNQSTVGQKADFAVVGYEKSFKGQILIFPRSLAKFKDRKVIGINYDLIAKDEVERKAKKKPRPETAPKPKPKAVSKTRVAAGKEAEVFTGEQDKKKEKVVSKTRPQARSKKKTAKKAARRPVKKASQPPKPKSTPRRNPKPKPLSLATIKQQLRKALEALEKGNQVLAYKQLDDLMKKL
jgi:hypothetical protein